MSQVFNPYQFQLDQLDHQLAEAQQLLSDPELAELAKADIERLENEKRQLLTASEEYLSSQEGSSDEDIQHFTNCTIEIRGGAGGEEAKIWADDLLRMYMRFIENQGLKVEVLDDGVIKVKGKTMINEVQQTAYDVFMYESGVHRVQRVPETEAQGRIHTSTASVAVLPEVHKTAVEIKDEDLEWQFFRAGGAGGQNVNKVNSAVRLIHKPTQVTVTCRSERSQGQNREIALGLLRAQVWELEEEKRQQQLGEARSVIGRAMRAEKIRTYNYPQNRVTDHRINTSWYNLERILGGDLIEVVTTLQEKMVQPLETSSEEISDTV